MEGDGSRSDEWAPELPTSLRAVGGCAGQAGQQGRWCGRCAGGRRRGAEAQPRRQMLGEMLCSGAPLDIDQGARRLGLTFQELLSSTTSNPRVQGKSESGRGVEGLV